jgi:hypothetical protein
MEFTCVLSVGGSLATYIVRREDESNYLATLKTGSNPRNDIPAEIRLEKQPQGWQASPQHKEIVTGLTHAIDMNP